MNRLLASTVFLLLSGSLYANKGAPTAIPAIDGIWQASYAVTGTPRAYIRLATLPSGEVEGKVEKAFPRPGENPPPICIKCTGKNKDKPIIGLKVVWGMMPDGKNHWDDGYVLDAETGKVYTGQLTLADNGNELDLRGYVLAPIFGETDTWKRIQ